MDEHETYLTHHRTHYEQPAFECFLQDQRLSKIGLFFCCFVMIGVFYIAVVRLQINRMLPLIQLPPLHQPLSLQANPAISSSPPVASAQPSTPVATVTPAGEQAAASTAAASRPLPTPIATAPPAPASAVLKPVPTPIAPRPSTQPPATYVVQPGDTLFSIARRYRVTVASLAAANSLPSSDLVKAGETLRIR